MTTQDDSLSNASADLANNPGTQPYPEPSSEEADYQDGSTWLFPSLGNLLLTSLSQLDNIHPADEPTVRSAFNTAANILLSPGIEPVDGVRIEADSGRQWFKLEAHLVQDEILVEIADFFCASHHYFLRISDGIQLSEELGRFALAHIQSVLDDPLGIDVQVHQR